VRIRAGGLVLILVGLYLWPEPSADTLATGWWWWRWWWVLA